MATGTHWKSCRECGAKIAVEPHEFGEDGVCFCGCVEDDSFRGYAAAPAEKTVSLKLVIIISVIVILIFAAVIIIVCKKRKS